MTVVQIRGTSGSGKSTVMRQIMGMVGGWEPVVVPGRSRPLYYTNPARGIVVLGHYNSPCGGCDTIGSARAVYDLTQELLNGGGDVRVILQEGLLLSEDVKWSSQLQDLRVLFLDTPVTTCLDRINARRRERGDDTPLNPYNTENRVKVIDRARLKLEEAGVECRVCPAERAVGTVLLWLWLHAEPRGDLRSSRCPVTGRLLPKSKLPGVTDA